MPLIFHDYLTANRGECPEKYSFHNTCQVVFFLLFCYDTGIVTKEEILMKYLIASDLHGSAHFCRAMLAAAEREQADRIVLLGDLLYHGPRNNYPEEYDTRAVTALLNGVKDKPLCVRGNCDSEVDQMVLEFPVLAEYAFLEADGLHIFATHGHNYGPDRIPPLCPGDYLLCGHIHLPVCRKMGEITYLNPGSLSLPKEGTPHSYMTLENGVFTWHDLNTGATFEPIK